MQANSLVLPAKTPHIVVDPLQDFVSENGPFWTRYGQEDIRPLSDVIRVLEEMTLEWQESAYLILCKSQYAHDQFIHDGLVGLCTADEGRSAKIPETRFARTINKGDNSVFSADVSMEELLGQAEFIGIEGLTTTSCVRKSVEDFRRRMNDRVLVVPRDAVAARKERTEDARAFLDSLASINEKNVIVVPTWRGIDHR